MLKEIFPILVIVTPVQPYGMLSGYLRQGALDCSPAAATENLQRGITERPLRGIIHGSC